MRFLPASLLRLMAGVTLACVAGEAPRALAADFYEGKTITIIVGNDAGSAYDAYARVLSRHMAKYIPGKPNILVQDMNGAGSKIAAQYLYAVSPKDGTAFGILFPGAVTDPLIEEPGKFRYDPTRFAYIGTADSGTRLCFTGPNSKVKTFADAQREGVLIAATSPGSSSVDYPNFFNTIVGTKFKVVTGYPGPGALVLTLERGEADGICALDMNTLTSLRPDWLTQKGKVNFLLQTGIVPRPDLLAFGVPSMWDFIPQKDRPLAELFVGQQVFSRPFVAPPNVPADRVAILRSAFMAALRDPDLLQEAKTMKLDINPLDGAAVEAVVKTMYGSPKELIDRMAKAIRP